MINFNWPHWLVIAKIKVLTRLSHVKVLWNVWHLHTFILVSLGFQIVLIFLAPFRKKTGNTFVIVIIWLAYLLADYVAIQAVGLIPNYNTKSGSTTDPDLLAFWAPFLLVHLGGPDPITALALEDNELWTRTALHLLTYGSATGRVFFQSLPSNYLWAPTILMFVAGILKFLERTMSLYNARLTKFKSSMLGEPDPGPNYAKLMESFDSYKKSALPARFDTNPEPDQYKSTFTADRSKDGQPLDPDEESTTTTTTTTNRGVDQPAEKQNTSCWEWFKYWCCCCCLRSAGNGTVRPRMDRQKLRNVKLVRDAFEFYEKYKGLYVDLIFTFHDRNKSRKYFLEDDRLTEEEAFKVLEMELNFTYEVFYTKMIVIHQTSGFWIRAASSAMELLSLLVWILFIQKGTFKLSDIWITYTLLVGALVIDLIAFLMVKSSDWQVAMLSKESERRAWLYNKLLSLRKRTWGKLWGSKNGPWVPRIQRVFNRRWSETVSQFSLICYCVDRWGTGATILFTVLPPLEDMCEGFIYVSKKWFPDELRDFIYHEIKYKAEIAEDPKDAEEICDSKGDWVLRSLAGLHFEPFDFYRWTCDVEYDECLLLWHVATELLYQEEEQEKQQEGDPNIATDSTTNNAQEQEGEPRIATNSNTENAQPSEGEPDSTDTQPPSNVPTINAQPSEADAKRLEELKFRNISKTLADYMMYLLNRQPVLMFAVAGISEVRYRDTCAEANIFFDRVMPKQKKNETMEMRMRTACKRLMDVNTETNPKDIKGDRSKSVLFDAVQLAKALKVVRDKAKTSTTGMWELIAKVWVELLSYSATHTRASAHAAQLKQGGQLLTLVWLLMVHLGLGKQFRITQGNARSKLIISK